ncbi:MAG: hypothetical protein EXX96DRAFT_561800 [Benjaminiella poitrasii]|nr:MAG: hypothetical protein EXX96DRAFT_561800 [Benjaminiella poitrasii]
MSISDKYKNLKVKDLQELLQKNNLPHTGKKEELIERLVKFNEKQSQELASLEAEFDDLDEFDESKVNLDDVSENDKHIEDLTNTELEDIMDSKDGEINEDASNDVKSVQINTKSEINIAKSNKLETKPNSNFKYTPITFDNKSSATISSSTVADKQKATVTTTNKNTALGNEQNEGTKAANDVEKALERAKRFGIQLKESTKKEIRAQRFGTAANNNTDKTVVKKANKLGIDPEILKKRAERFGIASSTAGSAKEKALTTVADPVEEEKKRKRAERFSVNTYVNKKAKN